MFVTWYDFCSVSHSCRKLAYIPCCNLRFTNEIKSSNLINLFPSSPLPCLLTSLPSYQPTLTKSSLLNRQLDFFVVLSTNTSHSSLRKTKMCLFFPDYWCNQIKWNYVLGPNSNHPLVQMLQPLLGSMWVLYLEIYAIKAQSDRQKVHVFFFKQFIMFVIQ